MLHHFITGIAGFIGSHLADLLLAAGDRVSGLDDLSLGRMEHLNVAQGSPLFRFIHADCSVLETTREVMSIASEWGGQPDVLWHMAANSDIAAGVADPSIDFNRTLKTTFATLSAAKAVGVRQIALASTSAVYGERPDVLTEDSGPLLPISSYGATKLASEALLSAAAESFVERMWVFRFPNVVGPRATHGAIFDFVARLRAEPTRLRVLGNGTQTKPYLHVSELISAMRFIVERAKARRNVFNIGPEGPGTSVAFMAEKTVERVAPSARIVYSGGDRGWVGDVPTFRYSIDRLKDLGWRPALSSNAAVLRAIDDLAAT